MKTILVMALVLTMIGCDKKEENKPVEPVPTATPVIVETPTPSLPVVGKDAAYCVAEGKSIKCGHPQWFNLDCGQGLNAQGMADVDGDYTSYFKDLAEAKALVDKTGVTARIKMKDGSTVQYGIGFAAPCNEI